MMEDTKSHSTMNKKSQLGTISLATLIKDRNPSSEPPRPLAFMQTNRILARRPRGASHWSESIQALATARSSALYRSRLACVQIHSLPPTTPASPLFSNLTFEFLISFTSCFLSSPIAFQVLTEHQTRGESAGLDEALPESLRHQARAACRCTGAEGCEHGIVFGTSAATYQT